MSGAVLLQLSKMPPHKLQIKCLLCFFWHFNLSKSPCTTPKSKVVQQSLSTFNVAWQEVPKKVKQIWPKKEIHDKPPIKPLQKKTRSSTCKTSSQMSTYRGSFVYHSSFMYGLCPLKGNSSRRKLRLTSSLEYLVLDNHDA